MNSPRERDHALLVRVAERDCSAAEQLFDRYHEEIFAYLARRMGRVDAEDLLQEVFVRALRRASTFRGESSARTWLFGIARFVLMERRRRPALMSEVDHSDESMPGPESMLIRSERATQLIAALERLPDDQAIVFELHQVDGYRHEQIAELLGIRAATSRKRLQRATETLQQLLSKGGADAEPRHHHLDSWARSLRIRTLAPESTS